MAPTPSAKSNPHTPSKPNQTHFTYPKTPKSQPKHRINFSVPKPSPNPTSTIKDTLTTAAEHPVEVIGRIRDYPDPKEKPISELQINSDRQSLRVKTDIGYRDFSFDGVSMSEEEDLDGFYRKFVESRIKGVKLGAKCTIMMYGPTGSGKSHTMFGCAKQQGIVYKSLRDILGEGDEESVGVGLFVQVTVLEIYNEEIYDLLSTNNGGGLSLGWPKGSASKVRLEVMGKKAKNATFISGNEAVKISKEIQKVEKRRIVKSTLCNERSSRSHCMIILDVPTVGGRLMLVDMAGSENIEQAGQIGLEAKMQTGKINQGNIALKRVVESIANGDSHVPFRDSKLTMLLQDSFEDDKSKILMILCASPDPKEMHKTISTLEYGAKAKCIVRGPHTPLKDKNGTEDSSSAVIVESRIAAMEQFICKLQMENKLMEKERNDAKKELLKKEKEISSLRAKLALGKSEEEINLKVNERTQMLKRELEKKIQECEKMSNDFVEFERGKMEERILQQQQEVEMLRRRLVEIELELRHSRDRYGEDNGAGLLDGSSFAKRLLEIYSNEDPGMEKSMDLDKSMDLEMAKKEPFIHNVKHSGGGLKICNSNLPLRDCTNMNREVQDAFAQLFANKASLSTVFEEGEEVVEQEEAKEKFGGEEEQKEVIAEKIVYASRINDPRTRLNFSSGPCTPSPRKLDPENAKDTSSSRRKRIQTIFTLCGNYRELSQHNGTALPTQKNFDPRSSPGRTIGEDSTVKKSLHELKSIDRTLMNKRQDSDEIAAKSKENYTPLEVSSGDAVEVYVKWEVSKEHPGKFIGTLKAVKDATLADLRKLVEIHLGANKQAFNFLVHGDPTPVPREKEATMQVSKLPICNQSRVHLACLRPVKQRIQGPNHLPFSPLQNIVNITSR